MTALDRALGLTDDAPPPPPVPEPRRQRSRSSASRRPEPAAAAHKRLDIQGLRAVAVVAVVVNHLFGHPQGGFVGVDVFFVISGFLITGHLLREEVKTGRISLLDFYRRRIRRLFPAALTVTVVTVVVGYVIFEGTRAKDTLVDALWATGFLANWRFLALDSDYFQSYGPVSPLRHYWSLSVEEQFYVVWPLVLLAILVLAKPLLRGRNAAVISTATAAVVLCASSLVLAWQLSGSNPTAAYYSTFTRGWELGLGALLAILAPKFRLPKLPASLLSWAGLAAIAVSFFVVTEANFPFPGALLPVLGSAAVVAAGSEAVVPWAPLLTNRVSVYLGDVSYSVYVVHFPVVIFAGVLVTEQGPAYYFAALAIILGLSMLLFHLIENPVRLSNWLKPRRERGDRSTVHEGSLARPAVLGLGAAVLGTCIVVMTVDPGASAERYQQIAAAVDASPSTTAASDQMPDADPLGPAAVALADQVKAALLATSWPDINPAFDANDKTDNHGCPRAGLLPADQCTWGNPDATKTMYLIGDSTSAAYFTAFVNFIDQLPDWKIRLASGSGCAFESTELNDALNNTKAGDCPARNQQLLDEVTQTKPDLLVLTNHVSDDTWTASEDGQLAKMKGSFGKLLVMPAPPNTVDPVKCKTAINTPADCVSPLPGDYDDWMRNDAALAAKYGGTFINPLPWTCQDGLCPVFVGTSPMKKDSIHITDTFGQMLAPVILEAFKAKQLL